MKVLLIKPAYRNVYGPIRLAAGNYFLLGLGYIAAYLRQHQHEVSILDPEAQGLSYTACIEEVKKLSPELIGISATTPDFANALKIAKLCKESSRAFLLLGGIHGTSMPEYVLKEYPGLFDAVCIGEGEETSLEICKFLQGEIKTLKEIAGLCFVENGQMIKTLPRQFITDLDSLPFPARDLVDLNLYKPHTFNTRKGKTATIITSRGCPFRCTFCASKLTLGGRFRARSAENVLQEIRHLVRRYGVNHILIQDDTFTYDVDRAKEICRKIIDGKLQIEWFAFSQVTRIDEELFSLMKRAGCYCVGYGIESVDKEVLKNIRKPNTIEQCEFAINMAKKYRLRTQAYFIFGNKGDTKETIKKTIDFALKTSPTFAFFNKLVPYPGTEIFHDYFKDDYKGVDWRDFVPYGVNAVCSTQAFSKRDLELLAFKANLLFYFRPSQLLEILRTIKSLPELKAYLIGGLGLILQMIKWRRQAKR